MDGHALIPIAQLEPTIDSTQTSIRGIVTIVWPYSASRRAFSILLAEPDFRLRYHKGQVRVTFLRSCAIALARAGINTGDELILRLDGCTWLPENTTLQTPGRSAGWELSFGKRVRLQAKRSDGTSRSVDIQRTSPSPDRSLSETREPATPVRASSPASSSGWRSSASWSIPKFLGKREFESSPPLSTHGLLAESNSEADERAPKRLKPSQSHRAWRFVERSPSPEHGVRTEDGQSLVQVALHNAAPPADYVPLRKVSFEAEGHASGKQTDTLRQLGDNKPVFIEATQNSNLDSIDTGAQQAVTIHPVSNAADELPSPPSATGGLSKLLDSSQMVSNPFAISNPKTEEDPPSSAPQQNIESHEQQEAEPELTIQPATREGGVQDEGQVHDDPIHSLLVNERSFEQAHMTHLGRLEDPNFVESSFPLPPPESSWVEYPQLSDSNQITSLDEDPQYLTSHVTHLAPSDGATSHLLRPLQSASGEHTNLLPEASIGDLQDPFFNFDSYSAGDAIQQPSSIPSFRPPFEEVDRAPSNQQDTVLDLQRYPKHNAAREEFGDNINDRSLGRSPHPIRPAGDEASSYLDQRSTLIQPPQEAVRDEPNARKRSAASLEATSVGSTEKKTQDSSDSHLETNWVYSQSGPDTGSKMETAEELIYRATDHLASPSERAEFSHMEANDVGEQRVGLLKTFELDGDSSPKTLIRSQSENRQKTPLQQDADVIELSSDDDSTSDSNGEDTMQADDRMENQPITVTSLEADREVRVEGAEVNMNEGEKQVKEGKTYNNEEEGEGTGHSSEAIEPIVDDDNHQGHAYRRQISMKQQRESASTSQDASLELSADETVADLPNNADSVEFSEHDSQHKADNTLALLEKNIGDQSLSEHGHDMYEERDNATREPLEAIATEAKVEHTPRLTTPATSPKIPSQIPSKTSNRTLTRDVERSSLSKPNETDPDAQSDSHIRSTETHLSQRDMSGDGVHPQLSEKSASIELDGHASPEPPATNIPSNELRRLDRDEQRLPSTRNRDDGRQPLLLAGRVSSDEDLLNAKGPAAGIVHPPPSDPELNVDLEKNSGQVTLRRSTRTATKNKTKNYRESDLITNRDDLSVPERVRITTEPSLSSAGPSTPVSSQEESHVAGETKKLDQVSRQLLQEAQQADAEEILSRSEAEGLRTQFGYFTPLSNLDQYFKSSVDILSIIVGIIPPERASTGPRDWHMTFHVTDRSVDNAVFPLRTVQIFRPSKTALPTLAALDDAILLHDFQCQSNRRRPSLISTASSSWVIFGGNGQAKSSGPPVEYGDQEIESSKTLNDWWRALPDEKRSSLRAKVMPARESLRRRSGRKSIAKPGSITHELRDGTKYPYTDTPLLSDEAETKE